MGAVSRGEVERRYARVREAGRHGVDVPRHAALYALVRGKEASYR